MLQDKKYGNSALFTLCQEIFKVRSDKGLQFLEMCFGKIKDAKEYRL